MEEIQEKLIHKRFPDSSPSDINKLLNLTPDKIPDTFLMTDSLKFIDTLKKYLDEGKNITISADYDADGILSGTLFQRALGFASEKLSSSSAIRAYFPDRVIDGYGINPVQIKRLFRKYPKTDVVATTDNGIAAFEGAEEVYRRGHELLISDHHLPRSSGKLPKAEAIVDPNRLNDNYPFGGISGTTVIYKLMREFYKKYLPSQMKSIDSYIDYVGVSVLSDIMPMVYENRIYVREALARFNGQSQSKPHYQLAAILKEAAVNPPYDETAFGYYIGPVLNSSSRVTGSPNDAAYLLQAKTKGEADSKIDFMVNYLNQKRKDLAMKAFLQAQDELKNLDEKKIILWHSDDLPAGIAGLVSGRLTEKFHKPSMVFSKVDELYKGSGRSIPGIDLVSILQALQDDGAKMVSFGGHSAAAGMAISVEDWDNFVTVVDCYSKTMKISFQKQEADFVMRGDEISIELLKSIDKLRPFGNTFEDPTFELTKLKVNEIKYMGKEKQHIKIKTPNIDLIQFNKTDDSFLNSVKETGTARGRLSINEWNGNTRINLLAEK